MNATDKVVTHDLSDVCARVRTDAAAFVAAQEEAYERQIEQTAATLASAQGCQIVWQCGASSVGKTTTAKRLSAALEARGVRSFVVSLDDFYRGREQAPLLPDGTYDYESPEALDLARLQACIEGLLRDGEAWLPQYDFTAGRPADTKTYLRIAENTVVIFEGIHAFTPAVTATAAAAPTPPVRLLINTRSRFTDGEEILLSRREIRLSRRLLRDERTRNSDFERTMRMWQQVLRGDAVYIDPYTHNADLQIDTTLGYEPCVLREPMLRRLPALYGTAFEDTAKHLEAVYERFVPLAAQNVPQGSVLREFIGR